MHQISVKDFPDLQLGDKRRNERFVSIINNINRQPGSSIPKHSASWYDTKATYSFFSNENVTTEKLQAAIASFGKEQIGHPNRLLIAHDISEISYNDLQAEGLGYMANANSRGILNFSSIAISEDGTPLSLLYQHNWVRPDDQFGKAEHRKQLGFEEKESYNWYKGITSVNQQLADGFQKIHIADREADIFDLFFCAYQPDTDLLIRAHHNRKLAEGNNLWDAVSEQPANTTSIQIPDKKGTKRTPIEVAVKYYKVEILRPLKNDCTYESVEMTAIEVKQTSDQYAWQQELVHWQLLTTLSVTTVAEALQCVQWYCYRWLIERFHYVLKSGTKIETLQLKHAASLQKAIHVYSIAAMRIMQLVYQSRQTPDISCETVLTKEQWIVLYILVHKKNVPPEQHPPSLADAVMWIAKLGGHLGRKSDGPPGLKTVWLGYQRVCDA
ncbi:IS4 family transposase, partial [Aetokthonos hydrillicola]|uniref:IS4 family transposase n=1 Tax=Aetokthonos hydrillicola TaxID=1550245 RepID=UPI0030D965FB